ncbi:uncharacterized protein CIMG_12165 [Coccidioides immitis RS]|uniref:Uncharacterized protein n=1 Tax=Coccidioides immitis (strain RS) TaxID=246410 RepID=A0A0D8JV15_COCIM|nr:uncharacterized protein CIMG_12165 [Coccidioides immitis RS]KJF60771.1 hypothetical protein CIMG_12165 [Coccidioides immitis RS]
MRRQRIFPFEGSDDDYITYLETKLLEAQYSSSPPAAPVPNSPPPSPNLRNDNSGPELCVFYYDPLNNKDVEWPVSSSLPVNIPLSPEDTKKLIKRGCKYASAACNLKTDGEFAVNSCIAQLLHKSWGHVLNLFRSMDISPSLNKVMKLL